MSMFLEKQNCVQNYEQVIPVMMLLINKLTRILRVPVLIPAMKLNVMKIFPPFHLVADYVAIEMPVI